MAAMAIAVTCLRSLLKAANAIMGIVGIAIILYGLWLLRVLQREINDESSPFHGFTFPTPWFAYTSIGAGMFLCVITWLGHSAANSVHGYCLSCYALIIILILLLESAVTADILLNSSWEKDLPEDPTGKFQDLKNFVIENLDICKWIGLVIISAQGLSVLLAMALRAIRPKQGSNYDSEDDYSPARLPLLKDNAQTPPCVVGDTRFASNNNTSWSA